MATAYHIDEPVAAQIARQLRALGRPLVTCEELGLRGAPDYVHLFHAAAHGRAVLTNNWRDFELLHGAWRYWSEQWGAPRPHPGICVLDQHAPAEETVAAILALESWDWPLVNELYRWRRRSGWERRTER